MVAPRGLSGPSVLSFKYKTGVIVAIGTSASYGYLSVPHARQIYKLTDTCIAAFSGSISDTQFLYRAIKSEIEDDAQNISPQGIMKLLQRILYSRRNKLDLLSVSVVISGINTERLRNGDECGGKPFEKTDEAGRFVGVVNSKGNFWFDDSVATGLGSHLVLPILRDRDLLNMGRDEAIKVVEECMRVMCRRDIQSSKMIQVGLCERSGIEIKEPHVVETDWQVGILPEEIVL